MHENRNLFLFLIEINMHLAYKLAE